MVMSTTPLTDAVDEASYVDPHAHREALRKLCRELEEQLNGHYQAAFDQPQLCLDVVTNRLRQPIRPWA
jgi:hypothetical protein